MASEVMFAGGRWTESKYKAFVRSALRRAWVRWPVRADVLLSARRASQRGDRTKYEYQCNSCKEWFKGSEVSVDHIRECGSMDDMNAFIGTLFCEEDNLQCLCHGCHRVATADRKR